MNQIICVDDEQSVLRALRRLFMDEEDYELLMVGNGLEALDLLQECDPAIIISDYRMPEMNGVEFLKRSKEIRPDALRIILSGYADAAVIVSLINDGQIYKFIPKPWDDQEMLVTIRRAIEQYVLAKENRRLTEKIIEQNELLQRMNEELERRVAERTQELTFKNYALQIAHNILNQVSIGIIGVSDDGMIVQTNRMACTLLGVDSGRLVGSSIEDVLPPVVLEKIAAVVRRPQPGVPDDAWRGEIEVLSREKILCTPLRNGNDVYGAIVQLLAEVGNDSRQER